MKKVRFLALSLVVAVALMGAGYAYWTDTLTINNTVSTGELKVEFTDNQHYPKVSGTNEYVETFINQDDAKTTTVTVGNLHPGTQGIFSARVDNLGTIPAKFDNVKIDIEKDELGGNLAIIGGVIKYKKDQVSGNVEERSFSCYGVENLEATINTALTGLQLEPDEYIKFDLPASMYTQVQELVPEYVPTEGNSIYFILPKSIDNDDNAENKEVKFDITLNWKQHNAQ